LLIEVEPSPTQDAWPAEVGMILSAMEAAPQQGMEKRAHQRMNYHVQAKLTLFADGPMADPWTLFTRDADPRGLGFISRDRLPLGYGGWVELQTPDGRATRIACTLYRCREAIPGWYEGALYFNREQWMFGSPQEAAPIA
jgi:hypothetical protein